MSTFIAIDLKSYYASVECVERGLDPLTTNLVVADESRTDKTICLAVSPSLKAYGIAGRARLFEVQQKVRELNRYRRDPITFIIAPPRMAYYIKYSTRIYEIYLKYFAAEDIHVYSIDEVFIDATSYLSTYGMSAHELTVKIIRDVLTQTGITATAGIGTNLYLCKVAMDIVAKHVPADKDGVRIAELNEISYRQKLWEHTPLTDFWRLGPGTAVHLNKFGIKTMGDLALFSTKYEDFLFKKFGVMAELLIDHAWGYEPCTIQDIKRYRPQTSSLSHGQVLSRPYTADEARIVALEIIDSLALELVSKHLLTSQVNLTVCYDKDSLRGNSYSGPLEMDRYGRKTPKHTQGVYNFTEPTSSGKLLADALKDIFDRTTDSTLLIRRMYVSVNKVIDEENGATPIQLSLFGAENQGRESREPARERELQEAVLNIRKKFGSNSILKGLSFEEGATAKERNSQIGGHKA